MELFSIILFKIKLYLRQMIYFSFFSVLFWIVIFSNYGLIDFLHFKHEINQLEKKLFILKEKKELLLHKTNAMKEEIDLDLLEIQIKNSLFYTRKNEIVYFWR